MGYKINSTWTRMRQNDIEELNAIIDDEYCNELEIGRKLNMMKAFKKSYKDAVNDFNFDTVIKFMTENSWTWACYDDSKCKYAVPTKERIIKHFEESFKHGLFNIIELNETSYSTFSGGVIFDMDWIDGKAYVEIYFDIAHYKND